MPLKTDWSLPVLHDVDCPPCACCGEPYCEGCQIHYFECAHPGPHSEPPGPAEEEDADA